MKLKFSSAAALLLCISAVPHASAQQVDIVPVTDSVRQAMLGDQRALRFVPGQVIVKYRLRTADAEAQLRASGLEGHVTTTSGGEYIYRLPVGAVGIMSAEQAERAVLDAVQTIAARGDVEYAQPNYLVHIFREPDDPGYDLQWHYWNNGAGARQSPGGINLPDAWDATTGAPAVVVAVLDTGILPAHAYFAGSPNVVTGFVMISSAATANDGDGRDGDPTDPGDASAANECFAGSPPRDSSWHGTHVAGTVGVGNTDNANGVAGINWNSSVQAVRVLGKCGGSISDINDGIRWAAGLPVPGVPNNATPARVINMSLGAGAPCSASPATQSAINDAVAAGVTVVVAAGNEASDAANSLPASCDNVITVAASDFRGHLVSRYSNFGDTVEIMAPGGDTQRDDNNDGNPDGVLSMVDGGFAFFNGTSMASPHVAGVAALLLAQDPQLTPARVAGLIVDNALPRSSQQCPRPCGAGLLNANIQLGGTEPPPPPPPPPPPEPTPVVLSVVPDLIELDEGKTAVITVTVTRGGTALAGETVSYLSADSEVAFAAPGSGETDSAGDARATITGLVEGDTEIVVGLPAHTQTTPVTVDVEVASALGWYALLALLALAGYRRVPLARWRAVS